MAAGIKEQAWERITETKREGSTVVWEDVGRTRQMRPHKPAWVFDLYLKISWKLLKCFKVEKWQKQNCSEVPFGCSVKMYWRAAGMDTLSLRCLEWSLELEDAGEDGEK